MLPLSLAERLGKGMRWLAYGLFGSLFVFELLNFLHILSYRVDYTWRGRLLSTAFVFLFVRGMDYLFERTIGKRLSGWVWFAAAILILVDFSGDLFFLYNRWDWYDRFAHALSGPLVAGTFVYLVISFAKHFSWNVPSGILFLLAFGIHECFAVLYEIEEYLEDVIFGSNRSGGGTDTANDIFLSFVCGLMTILFVWLWLMGKKRSARRKGSELTRENGG